MKRSRLGKRARRILRGGSRGMTLIEVLIALALFTIIAITFLGGLTVAARAVFIGDVRTTAESLARAQMEYIKSQDYIDYSVSGRDPEDYAEVEGYPSLYSMIVVVEPLDANGQLYACDAGVCEGDDGLQRITITVSHEGESIFTLEGYRVDR